MKKFLWLILLLCIFLPARSEIGVRPNLVLWLKLYDPPMTSSKVFDYSFNDNIGTLTDCTISYPGISFNGTSSQIDCGAANELDIFQTTDICTIMVWFKYTANAAAQVLLSMETAGDGYVIQIADDSTGLQFATRDAQSYTLTKTIDAKWHQVSIVYDSSFDVSFYYDGVYQSKVIHNSTVGYATSASLYIGRGRTGLERWFKGKIGEVRIYNGNLTTSEIRSIYETTRKHFGV